LNQAKAGRETILNEMNKTISASNAELKPHTPRIVELKIDKEFIGAVIGPGGKIIQGIQAETGATLTIEESGDFGIVQIFGNNKESIDRAVAWVKGIASKPEIGTIYDGTIKNVVEFGAFVEILPGKEGLLHISEIDWKRIPSMEGIFNTGDKVQVKLIEIDNKTGKLRLSRKVLLPKEEKSENA
jgi:polyribonucleotide nucleotidyltransferase